MSDSTDSQPDALPLAAMPWQVDPPLHSVGGFRATVGSVQAFLGYAMWPTTVYLCANIQFAGQPSQAWRGLWASRKEAMRAAENLCGEVQDYLCGTLNGRLRETEDLDMDDFLEHLYARINNELH